MLESARILLGRCLIHAEHLDQEAMQKLVP